MPTITSDVWWLLRALIEKFVCLQVDLFEIFHESLIYKTKTWLVYVHLVLACLLQALRIRSNRVCVRT
jgi:hypothetical protein